MLNNIEMSHIKVQYVREACHVVGVLFFPVSLTQSFMHPLLLSHCTACSSRQASRGCRVGFRRHPPARPWYHIQTRQSDGGCEYLTLQEPLPFTSSFHDQLKQKQPPVVWVCGFFPMLSCPLQSIMKNYDQNQDGYISLQDFEEIAANFPFSFCIRKTDRCVSRYTHFQQWKCETLGLQKPRVTNFCTMSWNFSCPGTDKSVVKKSRLTSSGECRYVSSWATTSMMHTTFMKPRINGLRFVIPVEALWVIILF